MHISLNINIIRTPLFLTDFNEGKIIQVRRYVYIYIYIFMYVCMHSVYSDETFEDMIQFSHFFLLLLQKFRFHVGTVADSFAIQ